METNNSTEKYNEGKLNKYLKFLGLEHLIDKEETTLKEKSTTDKVNEKEIIVSNKQSEASLNIVEDGNSFTEINQTGSELIQNRKEVIHSVNQNHKTSIRSESQEFKDSEIILEKIDPVEPDKVEKASFGDVDFGEDESSSEILESQKEEEKLIRTEALPENTEYSFLEWLRMGTIGNSERALSNSEVIDRFIQNKPKIVPNKAVEEKQVIAKTNKDYSNITSETLAELYVQQGKFKEAMEAYKTLHLKYPEKSSFFAAQIIHLEEQLKNI